MDHDVVLVLAGGLIGLASSVVALSLHGLWAVRDRKSASDAEALDLTVRALIAWKDVALGILVGEPNPSAQARLAELDTRWETDMALIPDQATAKELLDRCKSVQLMSSKDPLADSARIMELEGRVLLSARKRRRLLA